MLHLLKTNIRFMVRIMIYVMSDIHGEYVKYIAMLDKIGFVDNDILYILGDVLDRGSEPIRILKDMSVRSNVYPIMGNHELMAIDILKDLLVEITEDNYNTHIDENIISKMLEYQLNGGNTTLKKFKDLPFDDRFELLDYLNEFEPYDIVDVGEKTFILSHTGNIDINKKLADHSIEELTFVSPDYDKVSFKDSNVFSISGHTPTLSITGKPEIYYRKANINIDCGAVFGGKLACLRLDDMMEFYV